MIFRFDDIVVEPATFRLLRNGEPARIEPKALEVLIRLIERRDRVVTKQELLSDVWRGTVVTENALTRTIAQIRKVLGDDLQSPRYIQTIPTKGYRFIGEVRSETGQATASPAPVTPQPPLTLTAPRSSGMAWSFGVFAVIIVATALVGFVLLASAMKRTGLRIFGPAGKMTIDRDGAAARSPIAGRPLRPSDEVQSFPTFSPDGMSLAYAVDVGGSSHIFISRIGGAGEPHQLTTGDGETQPAWSPDGASIAYVAERRGGIFVVPVEGGEPRRVTTFGSRPQWSPDGRDIAFQSSETMEFGWTANDAHPPSTINIVNVSTRTVTAVTHPGQPAGGHGAPSWRRDGNRLAFSSCEIEICTIYTIARDGSQAHAIVTDTRRLSSPVFARTGDKLYYVLARYNDSLLLSIAIDGNGQRAAENPLRLRHSAPGAMQHIAVSNDGSRLAWTAVEESSDLYSIAIGGGEPKQLTRNPTLRSMYPAFSPDGSKIVYSAVAAGVDSGVWIIDADGTNAKAVEVGPGLKQHTGWLRDGYSVVWAQWEDGPALFKSSLITGKSEIMARLPRGASLPIVSPDGQNVAFLRTIDGVASLWTDATLRPTARGVKVDVEGQLVRLPVWSPDSETLAVQVRGERGGSAIGVIDLETSRLRLLTELRDEALPYSWSPDGREIAFAARRNGVWNIYAVSLDRRERKLTSNESTTRWFRSPAWSPAGHTIAYEAGVPKANVWVSEPRVVE